MKKNYREPIMKPVMLKTKGLIAASPQFNGSLGNDPIPTEPNEPSGDGGNIGDYGRSSVDKGWLD